MNQLSGKFVARAVASHSVMSRRRLADLEALTPESETTGIVFSGGGRTMRKHWPKLLSLLALLCVSALFLCADGLGGPIVFWDESRNVVNALEMRIGGPSLVTTYGFEPDLWNTKPPLLIWLMSGAVAVFGPSEYALRLPSAIAALGTIALVFLFTRRITNSTSTALTAGAFLLLSPGFFGEHGARTADYDALLLFFVTAYLYLLFFAIHRTRPPLVKQLLAGFLIACAVLTKSTAGLIPGVGVAVYLLLTRRIRLAAAPRYAALAIAAAAPVLIFLVAREAASPGYLSAAWHNDLAGRFSEAMVRRYKPPWYYVQGVMTGWFLAGPLILALPLVLRDVVGKSRAALFYSLCIVFGQFAVLSLSATKHLHYALPAFGSLAVAAAIILRALVMRLRHALQLPDRRPLLPSLGLSVVALLLLFQATRAIEWRYRLFPERQSYAQARYGELFSRLARQGVVEVHVIDRGIVVAGKPHYVPLLRSYQLLWRERGLRVYHHADRRNLPRHAVRATCDPASIGQARQIGHEIEGVAGCVASVVPSALALPAPGSGGVRHPG